MKSSAASVEQYIAALPPDRRDAISALRDVVRENLQPGFEEGVAYGMIGYFIPLSRYPETYNGQPLSVAAIASQKGYMSLYLMSVYGDPAEQERFEAGFRAAGKRLDMGKSCVRFKALDDLPLDVIRETIRRVTVDGYIARYEEARAQTAGGKRAAAKKAPEEKAPAKKPVAKKAPAKKPAR